MREPSDMLEEEMKVQKNLNKVTLKKKVRMIYQLLKLRKSQRRARKRQMPQMKELTKKRLIER